MLGSVLAGEVLAEMKVCIASRELFEQTPKAELLLIPVIPVL